MAFQQLRRPTQCRVHAAPQHKWVQQCTVAPPPCGKLTAAFKAATASIPTAIRKPRVFDRVPTCSVSAAVSTAELNPDVTHEDTPHTEGITQRHQQWNRTVCQTIILHIEIVLKHCDKW